MLKKITLVIFTIGLVLLFYGLSTTNDNSYNFFVIPSVIILLAISGIFGIIFSIKTKKWLLLIIIFLLILASFLPVLPRKVFTCSVGPYYICEYNGTLIEVTASNNPSLYYLSKIPVFVFIEKMFFITD